jgi:hypothetical protein
MNPRYPVFIPSKGRWESRHTSKALERMGVPYYIVVEGHEYDNYAAVIDPKKILTLPWSKPNSNTELVKARNWIKEYATTTLGAKRHWQLDDNIAAFARFNKNLQVQVTSGTIFRCAEDFVDRYTNVGIAGFQYDFFVLTRDTPPPYTLNTRVYSCSLINNEMDIWWRGIYNDDTDICIRALKDKWCTVLFYAFIQEKATTMTVKGGNTDIYQDDGRLKMAQSLQKQHPELVKITWRFNKWQHVVNYKPFQKNKLIKKTGLNIPDGVDNYGMELVRLRKSTVKEIKSNASRIIERK